jgi:hypothetical protein
MLTDVKEIEKIFRRSTTIMATSSQSQQKRPTPETPIMRLFSVSNALIPRFTQRTQVNPSPLTLTLSAIGKKKSVGPDGIPGEILKLGGEAMIPGYNDEQQCYLK